MSSVIVVGDALDRLSRLPPESVQLCVTSPPYFGLRDYKQDAQIGLERSPDEYIARLVSVFAEVRRVLKPDGTLWLNLGDSYAGGGCGARDPERWPKQSRNDHMPIHVKKHTGLPAKNLIGVPWRTAFALQAAGWILREDVIWHKTNPMPESVADRCVRAHEYLFHFVKSPRYFFDHLAIREPATGKRAGNGFARPERISHDGRGDPTPFKGVTERNKRSVWTTNVAQFKGAHFATFPPDVARPRTGENARFDQVVIDCFAGAGTTGLVAKRHGRRFWGCDLNPEYVAIAQQRIAESAP